MIKNGKYGARMDDFAIDTDVTVEVTSKLSKKKNKFSLLSRVLRYSPKYLGGILRHSVLDEHLLRNPYSGSFPVEENSPSKCQTYQ